MGASSETIRDVRRRLPVGAELIGDDEVHFRVWAPSARVVDVEINGVYVELTPEEDQYFSGIARARVGDRYRYRLDRDKAFPDPASRFQPDGPHGFSQLVDPHRYRWFDEEWAGATSCRDVIYELHIGTLTPEGTWKAAVRQLETLADFGITMLEVMPVAEFPGRFGWGYDGVNLFAPYHGYGAPDDFRHFVDRAHGLGMAVILDVVYNHLGPDGNYLAQFAPAYFSDKYITEWGPAINCDGTDCTPVRELIVANVRHWIAEYHLDGLRIDATHSMYDDSPRHILQDIGSAARSAAGDRRVVVIAENEPQDARLVRPIATGGYGLDAIWCDDFHHSATVQGTGRREAYFSDYLGSPQEFISLYKYGILYQGQYYAWQKKRRGAQAWDVTAKQCVVYLENHDQIANSRDGRRLHQLTAPARYRALSALLLLAPQTPLLFQGQEFGSTRPFLYFADHSPELAPLVRRGRAKFLQQFASIADGNGVEDLDDPGSTATFDAARLDSSERARHVQHCALYRDLISIRQRDRVLASDGVPIDGAVIGDRAFVIRFFGGELGDRLLVVNFGADLSLDAVPEPLLAPPTPDGWTRLWYSEDDRYGGRGSSAPESATGAWRISGDSFTLLG